MPHRPVDASYCQGHACPAGPQRGPACAYLAPGLVSALCVCVEEVAHVRPHDAALGHRSVPREDAEALATGAPKLNTALLNILVPSVRRVQDGRRRRPTRCLLSSSTFQVRSAPPLDFLSRHLSDNICNGMRRRDWIHRIDDEIQTEFPILRASGDSSNFKYEVDTLKVHASSKFTLPPGRAPPPAGANDGLTY